MSAPWDDEIPNPFLRDRFAPVAPEVQRWANALCRSFGQKPDKLVGEPPYPVWRAWVGYAELAIKAARLLAIDPSPLGAEPGSNANDRRREDPK